MQKFYRVHGDNIVECERVIKYITQVVNLTSLTKRFSSLACLAVDIEFGYTEAEYNWTIEMFPGFSKDNRSQRWQSNIFEALKANGSFLDETPDVIVTKVENGLETILFAIEFCSALQAGNQAWQRSGRAYSAGMAKCPYIYIVDFAKYELNSKTRKRIALRFPNPAVTYSYISFSKFIGSLVAQAYIASEEYRRYDDSYKTFDNEWLSESLICDFILNKMLGNNTLPIEKKIFENGFNILAFLASKNRSNKNFSRNDWEMLYKTNDNIIKFSKSKTNHFNFTKKVAKKSYVEGQGVLAFLNIVKELSVGIASKDLPFGFIPTNKINKFIEKIKNIYPHIANDFEILKSLTDDCVICMIKGFKPKGDDARPDRGTLLFATMLVSNNASILTYIYGPLIEKNYNLLLSNPVRLFETNGFWKAVLSSSDFIILDSLLLNDSNEIINKLIDNREIKRQFVQEIYLGDFSRPSISNIPNRYGEDDVDTVLHYIFSYLLENTFEGMCNPPGGDWSGLSIRLDDCEYRWLSLPRVSNNRSKRPDHVSEIVIAGDKPILFVVESKECGNDLEENIGIRLKEYIKWLMTFPPSVYRDSNNEWQDADEIVNINSFEMISVGAYIDNTRYDNSSILQKSKCDLLFLFTPNEATGVWKVEIMVNSASKKATRIKMILLRQLKKEKSIIQIC